MLSFRTPCGSFSGIPEAAWGRVRRLYVVFAWLGRRRLGSGAPVGGLMRLRLGSRAEPTRQRAVDDGFVNAFPNCI